MAELNFPDCNIVDLLHTRYICGSPLDVNRRLQMHSSLIRRLSLEKELEGHLGCVNALAWNSKGSLLISGSDDTRINIWSYTSRQLLHSIETGHSANIFCTKFIPETCDDLVVSGAGDAEVRLFHLSRLSGRSEEHIPEPSAVFNCHTRRVKKLAVEVGNPNVVWSASEDGTLRQHDFREGASCPPAGSSNQECRNVLLDLRSGAKKSLADSPKHCLALKSCDISTIRPHQLLIGGSDAFGRLYDRRMLPPLTSSQKRMKAPPCVNYFCPVHLADRVSDRGRSSLHLTHVTFSPNGEEVLLSYSGEYVYLMDVNAGDNSSLRYRAGIVPKQVTLYPILDKTEIPPSPLQILHNSVPENKNISGRLRKCYELVQAAEKALEGSNFLYGIEACNEVLDGRGPDIGSSLKHECLCTRAALFLKRKWKNDAHMAIRDCKKAQRIDSSSFKAKFCMSEALLQLGELKEALDYAMAAGNLAPSNSEAFDRVERLKELILADEAEKSNNDGASKSDMRPGRLRSLSDVFYRSEVNNDASQDGPRSERGDSDYEEEMELDFETSISGDEERDIESGILRGSLNLRFHRKSDSCKDKSSSNGSSGSPSSSSQTESAYQPAPMFDMRQRYVGHCNVGTDIKQASFLGQGGDYIASGSDDGRWFIWEKKTGRLIKMFTGDEAVVNCVQSHPFDCTIATSGIDTTIKIWTPFAQVPSIVAEGIAGAETADIWSVMDSNQQRLRRYRETYLPFDLLERFRMHDFAEGTLHPFECAQS